MKLASLYNKGSWKLHNFRRFGENAGGYNRSSGMVCCESGREVDVLRGTRQGAVKEVII